MDLHGDVFLDFFYHGMLNDTLLWHIIISVNKRIISAAYTEYDTDGLSLTQYDTDGGKNTQATQA